MNVLFLASWYPSSVSPTNGNFIQQHARAVSKYCKVAVLHVVSRKQDQDFTIKSDWNQGVYEVIVYYKKILSKLPVISHFEKLYRQKEAHRKGHKIILQEFRTINMVHLNVFFTAGIFALELKKKYKLPFITTEHWTAYLDHHLHKITFLEKWWIKKIARQSSIICPVSDDLKHALIKHGIQGNYEVVPNVVAPIFFEQDTVLPSSGKKRLLHISSLKDDQKNITGILNTIKKLSELRTDFELLIIGDGDPAPHIKLAKDLQLLNKFVFFEGPKNSKEIATFLKQSNCFILFSNYENQPCVILESLACGIPVISSDVGGIDEVIDKNNGFLVPARNTEALLTALDTMLDNYTHYNKEAISAFAEQFSFDLVGKQFYHLYKKVVGDPNA